MNMVVTLRCQRRQKGIGLLELMLSLAIIAILLIMATRYYQSASLNNKINACVDMFAGVQGAVQNYRVDNPGKIDENEVSVGALVQKGLLPPSYLKDREGGAADPGKNPFGGTITISNFSGGKYTVAMNQIPDAGNVCQKVASRVGSGIGGGSDNTDFGAECDDNGTVTATYPI